MGKKKRLTSKEKKLIRELLDEEELLLDEFLPGKKVKKKKARKKEASMLAGLVGEASKEYSEDDHKFVQSLLSRMPEKRQDDEVPGPKRDMDEELLHLKSTDSTHKMALEQALDSYPKIHRNQTIKAVVLTILAAIIFTFIVLYSGLFNLGEVDAEDMSYIVNRTLLTNRTVERVVEHNISLEDYLSQAEKYGGQITVFTGFLTYDVIRQKDVLRHKYYLEDDFGQKLQLVRINDRYLELFVYNGTTGGLYNVTGSLHYVRDELEFRVTAITATERPRHIEKETITEKEVITEKIPILPEDLRSRIIGRFAS